MMWQFKGQVKNSCPDPKAWGGGTMPIGVEALFCLGGKQSSVWIVTV